MLVCRHKHQTRFYLLFRFNLLIRISHPALSYCIYDQIRNGFCGFPILASTILADRFFSKDLSEKKKDAMVIPSPYLTTSLLVTRLPPA